MTYGSLEEFFEGVERYSDTGDGWSEYKQRFFQLGKDGRAVELASYDKLFEQESCPSRQTAEYIARRRELADIDFLCRRAGK
jgi:hypothetical protein